MRGYAWALAATVACTLVGLAMQGRFDIVNIAMIYLLAVVFVAWRHTRGAAVATTVVAVTSLSAPAPKDRSRGTTMPRPRGR